MTTLLRRLGLGLLAWFAITGGMMAQEEPLTVVGSNIAAPILQAIIAPEALPLNLATAGMASGFQAFCNNAAEIVAASRLMTQAEADLCALNGVEFQQYTLASYLLVVVVNSADPIPACLSLSQLNTLLQPSAANIVTDWSSVLEETELPLTVYLPASGTLDYAILDSVINGVGLRADALTGEPADLIETSGSLGVFPISALMQTPNLTALSIRTDEPDGSCIAPDIFAFESGLYPLGVEYYAYLNADHADRATPLVQALIDPASAFAIEQAGFVPPSLERYERNRLVSIGEAPADVFDPDAPLYVIPSGLSGQVTGGGQAVLNDWLRTASTQLTQLEQNLRVTLTFDGEIAGLRRFCNGELDFIVTSGPLTGEAAANCEASSIVPYEVPIGRKAVVLVANAADAFAACLTTSQLDRLWSVPSDEPITTWAQVDPSFPEEALTLFSPADRVQFDILLGHGNRPVPPFRDDTITNADPLFRAAAVANVRGGLTFMLWSEYQRVLANNQERIQLVAVDGGAGCVLPDETTIADGSYPLSIAALLLVDRQRLADTNVRAYLWTAFSDDSLPTFEAVGFIVPSNFFALTRAQLAAAFNEVEAELASAQPQPEATPETEATPEATTQPDAEATSEATAEAEATLEAAPQPEATEEATAAP